MSLTTLLCCLVGDATALQEAAANPWTAILGLVFVLSTGLARHYDTHDLRAQPWRIFVPLAVSLLLASLLFGVLVLLVGTKTGDWPPLGSGWWSLVGLFWLTAPLAWLYAIPYQRWPAAGPAVRARLGTLGLVALWRVLLLGRAVSLLFPATPWAGYAVVLLVADGVALAALAITRPGDPPRSTPRLVLGMAGIAPAQPAHDTAGVTCLFVGLAVLSLPVWLIATLSGKPQAGTWLWQGLASPAQPAALSLWLLGGMMLLLFAAVLFWTQPAQRRRSHVEALFRQGKLGAALEELSRHDPGDYPPGWQPPPQRDFRDPPRLLDVIAALGEVQSAGWVRALYLDRFRQFLSEPFWYWFYDADLERIADLLRQLPEGGQLAQFLHAKVSEQRDRLEHLYGLAHSSPSEPNGEMEEFMAYHLEPPPEPTGRRDATIAALWQLAGKGPPDGLGGAAAGPPYPC